MKTIIGINKISNRFNRFNLSISGLAFVTEATNEDNAVSRVESYGNINGARVYDMGIETPQGSAKEAFFAIKNLLISPEFDPATGSVVNQLPADISQIIRIDSSEFGEGVVMHTVVIGREDSDDVLESGYLIVRDTDLGWVPISPNSEEGKMLGLTDWLSDSSTASLTVGTGPVPVDTAKPKKKIINYFGLLSEAAESIGFTVRKIHYTLPIQRTLYVLTSDATQKSVIFSNFITASHNKQKRTTFWAHLNQIPLNSLVVSDPDRLIAQLVWVEPDNLESALKSASMVEVRDISRWIDRIVHSTTKGTVKIKSILDNKEVHEDQNPFTMDADQDISLVIKGSMPLIEENLSGFTNVLTTLGSVL